MVVRLLAELSGFDAIERGRRDTGRGVLEEAKNMARTLSDRGDRFGLVVASAAVAGVVIMGVLYTLTSERLRPAPKPSAETSPSSQSPGAGGG
jgi:hypothetical protein